jgi:hypothetical protein
VYLVIEETGGRVAYHVKREREREDRKNIWVAPERWHRGSAPLGKYNLANCCGSALLDRSTTYTWLDFVKSRGG